MKFNVPGLITCLTLLLCGASAAASDSADSAAGESSADPHFDAIYRMPTAIDALGNYCRWKTEGASGYVRLVRTRELDRDSLFLQWVRLGISGTESRAISTIEVEELSGTMAVRFEMPVEQLGSSHCRLKSTAEGIQDGRRYGLELVLTRPGHYQLHTVRHMNTGY